jgi:CheY-like chemotaxis protein
MLPKKSGLDVLRAVKADPSTRAIAVILLTVKDHDADVTLGLHLGADWYVPKPFRPGDIATLARRYQQKALRLDTIDQSQPHRDITYQAVRIAPNEIEHAVVNVLRFFESPGALVFCHTREAVRHLHGSLVERGFAAVALSGELSQKERSHALQALRDGRAGVRRNRCRGPRHRPSGFGPCDPRRLAGGPRDLAPSQWAYGPGWTERHLRSAGALHAAAQGRAAVVRGWGGGVLGSCSLVGRDPRP